MAERGYDIDKFDPLNNREEEVEEDDDCKERSRCKIYHRNSQLYR